MADSMSSLTRGLHVLEIVAAEQPIGVSRLARIMEAPKSTIHRTIKSLVHEGWLEPSWESPVEWVLAPKVRAVGHQARGKPSLLQAALPVLNWLGEETQETIHFGVPRADREVVLLERVDSPRAVRTYIDIGTAIPLHASSAGKAVMATWTGDRVRAYLDRGLAQITNTTITEPRAFLEELERVRATGYATNYAENRGEVFAVGAVAAASPDGVAAAAVAISMPDSRYDADRVGEWGGLLLDARRRIESALNRAPGPG
ncbi:IclR family transcriptional regulator [Monashia sp. NPDC004114]